MGKNVLAFDFGASGGRAMLGSFDGEKITLTEVHRFSNDPVEINGILYWDTLRLFFEIKQGILKAKHSGGFSSIGINTWGVDFGLLGEDGQLVESCVHYRDSRTKGMLEASEKYISNSELYEHTGNQLMEINTAFQLLALKEKRPHILSRAKTLLMTPDLFNYFLTGEKVTEMSIASTTQLFDFKAMDWSREAMARLGLPEEIFTKIIPSGERVGLLTQELARELGVERVPVIAVCGHDTQDAVFAVPAKEKEFIFLSCGTWSLFGTELEKPVINDTTGQLNLTNEAGFDGKTDLLNNIIGLWLIQESRRQWAREGKELSFAQLEKLALEAQAFGSFIDPDAEEFVTPGDIPSRIKEYCSRTGQKVPETVGEVTRCIYESLAMKYRYSLELIEKATGRSYDTIYIVGGGTKDGLLCRTAADVCCRKVQAGPVEATALGNIAIQLIAQGEIRNVSHAREIIAASESVTVYEPHSDADEMQQHYERFIKVTNL